MHVACIEFDVGQALLATMICNTQQAGGVKNNFISVKDPEVGKTEGNYKVPNKKKTL